MGAKSSSSVKAACDNNKWKRIQQNIWHAALRILVLPVLHAFVQPTEREGGVAAFPCPDHSAVAKAHHKNVNEVDRQRAKTHHSKGTAGAQHRAREAHRDPPEPSPRPRPKPVLHFSARQASKEKRQPIERNIC